MHRQVHIYGKSCDMTKALTKNYKFYLQFFNLCKSKGMCKNREIISSNKSEENWGEKLIRLFGVKQILYEIDCL